MAGAATAAAAATTTTATAATTTTTITRAWKFREIKHREPNLCYNIKYANSFLPLS